MPIPSIPLRNGGALLAVLVAILLPHAPAHACTSAHAGDTTSLRVDAWDDTALGSVISPWVHMGNAHFLMGCSYSEVIPIHVSAAMPGLEFVRHVQVEGESFPAFGLRGRPDTPLLIFQYLAGNGSGTTLRFPFNILTGLQFSGAGLAGSNRWSWVRVAAVSRGPGMASLPTTQIGTVTYATPRFAALQKRDAYNATATLRAKTCTFSTTSVTLRDVRVTDLPSAGSSTGERAFTVSMTCNGAFPLFLALTDANEAGNTGSRLTPTRNATAGAVRVKLLRDGRPVVLGQRWAVPLSQQGPQDIGLSARYYRESGTLHAGTVEGQAVITATYR